MATWYEGQDRAAHVLNEAYDEALPLPAEVRLLSLHDQAAEHHLCEPRDVAWTDSPFFLCWPNLQDAETWAAGYEGNDRRKWFGFVQSAANNLKALCGQRATAGDLVPYPLWGPEYEGLHLLQPNSYRLVYAAMRLRAGVKEAVVIKLTSEKYPEEVRKRMLSATLDLP